MKKSIFYLGLLTCLFLGSCSEDNNTPVDADDNFITSVRLLINNETYDAVIADNNITVTVPYTVSLNGATVSVDYTPSATIIPDPTTITDWDMERTFRVTSYNGETNDYTYVVIKDEIRHEGNVELKTQSDVASFVASGTTIIKGNLIIGSDAENAEEIKDISALEILKEVEGDIIIRRSYTGGTLTGLDNITTIGGLQIGTEETPAINNQLEMVSMANLVSVAGDISIYGSGVKFIEFKALETVEGNIIVNDAKQLSQILFHKLKDAGSINFKVLPRDFSTLTLPELTTVEGDLIIQGVFGNVHTGGLTIATGNTGLTSISGLDKLSKVGGTLSIQYFEELTSFPDFSNLTQIGGVYLTYNHKVSSFDISNADIIGINGAVGLIKLDNNRILKELKTKDDLTGVDVWLLSQGYCIKTNFTHVNNIECEYLFKESVTMPVQFVYGNFSINARTESFSCTSLQKVDGFMNIDCPNSTEIKVPELIEIGGQFLINSGTDCSINFAKLESICLSSDPHYAKKGEVNVTSPYQIGSFTLNADTKIEPTFFPVLKTIGGLGLTVYNTYQSASFPKLETIDGKFCFETTQLISANNLTLPKLKKLSGLHFYRVEKFDDFTFFSKFIDDGQITENNWKVERCTYNPTYEDMKAGRYKPAE